MSEHQSSWIQASKATLVRNTFEMCEPDQDPAGEDDEFDYERFGAAFLAPRWAAQRVDSLDSLSESSEGEEEENSDQEEEKKGKDKAEEMKVETPAKQPTVDEQLIDGQPMVSLALYITRAAKKKRERNALKSLV